MRSRITIALPVAMLIGALLAAQGSPPAAPLLLVSRDGRRPVPTLLANGQEIVALDDLAGLFQLTVREDALAGGVTVAYKGRTIVVSADQATASVAGRLVALPSPPVRAGRRWFVPVEFLSRALAPIYDSRIDLRKSSRMVIVGDLRVPRISARMETSPGSTRLTLDLTPSAAVAVSGDATRIFVHVEADALDMTLPLPGVGLIDQLRQGDDATTLVIGLKAGTGAARTSTSTTDAGSHVVIDIPAAGAAPQTSQTSPAATPAPPAAGASGSTPAPTPEAPIIPAARAGLQAIVIDPGHGGDDAGTKGAGGVLEKQLTLDIARRVKALIETRLGIRVLLTREDDRAVSLDERAAAANNSKADSFLSLHFNAALQPKTNGAEVYYLSVDREGQEALAAAQADALSLPVLGGGARAIDLIRWDMAQVRHAEASTTLATLLEEVLRARIPMGTRPLQQGPMRVLVGVDMPAALIELAYLTNPDQAKQAAGGNFQTSVTQALYDGVVRFRDYLEGRR